MIIRGLERHFMLGVRGRDKIAALCINGDIKNIADTMNSSKTTDIIQKMAIYMNQDYEDRKHYDDPDYQPDYITENDFVVMTMDEFRQLEEEVSDAFLSGMGITIEAEEPKGNSKGKKTTKKEAHS